MQGKDSLIPIELTSCSKGAVLSAGCPAIPMPLNLTLRL